MTGTFAVGSVVVSGIALGIHAFANLKEFLAWLTGLAAWDLLVAVPFVFVSYIVGLTTIGLSELCFDRWRGEDPRTRTAQILAIASQRSEFLAAEYAKVVREQQVLQGACPAVACFALGAGLKLFRSAPNIGGHLHWGRAVITSLDLALVSLVVVSWLLAERNHARIRVLIASLRPTNE